MTDELASDLASLRIDRSAPKPSGGSGFPVRAVVILVVLVGAVGALFAAWPHLEARVFKTKVKTTEVSLVSATQGSTTLTATGYVIAERSSKVAPKTPGRVSRVLVERGTVVRAGDVLVELEAADVESAIASARARVAAAQARVATARANQAEVDQQITRRAPLVTRGAAARSEVEDLEARRNALASGATAATAEVRAAQAEVESLRVQAGLLRILAPIDGTVLDEPAKAGETVGPGSPVVELADMTSLVVELDVPEGRLHTVRVGAPCEVVLDAFPDKRLRGETVSIGRRVNRAKATVPVRVRLTDANVDVLPDMAARVNILTERVSDEALRASAKTIIPSDAVVRRGSQTFVFVVEKSKAVLTSVTLGAAESGGFVMLSGPPPGTTLISEPPPTLADGSPVDTQGN